MNKLALLSGLLVTNFAFGEAPRACPQILDGKTSCVSGEKMLCNKEFDPVVKSFRYEWHAVNSSGQSFDVYGPYYRKVLGYTPATCRDSDPARGKLQMLQAKVRAISIGK